MNQFFLLLARLKALPAFLALLLAVSATSSLAQTPPCSITVVNVWSDDDKSFENNTLTVEEGANWDFDLKYSCTGLAASDLPSVTIRKPTLVRPGRFTITDGFRGGVSEVDGVGDGDALAGDCLTATGCNIEVFGTSIDNNCRNTGATVQEMRVETRVINSGPGDLNLSDLLSVKIVATDDDTVSQKYLDMGYTQWKPTC